MDAEAESLVRCLDEQRAAVLAIVDGLPEAGLRRAVFPSGWTCLGLIHHLAVDDERYWFRGVAAGEPVEFPVDEDVGWLVGPEVTGADVVATYHDEIARSNAIIAATPLDTPARRHDPRWDVWGWPPPRTVNLRWIILHMIEETARHAGHLDTARELLDGRTGLG
ncbi:MAG TPA: DinB family protein [Streptosporangiaceae bacterium]|nr:DinB family protein [Streptosporangiaceae bacterium]